MYKRIALCICLVLFATGVVFAEDLKEDESSSAKELSGMSIVGNDEAPKSLYIVPWKSSALGAETSLDITFNEDDRPVDRDVFKRKIEFYEISTKQ